MSLQDQISARGINEIVHFTTNPGLVGTLASDALLSRHRLGQEQYLEYVLHVNAARRPEAAADFDKSENWLDFVNLSISEINRRYFLVSNRWHTETDIWWCILSFDAKIVTHDGVFFATTNNSYELTERGSGDCGFEKLFTSVVRRKPDWNVVRGGRAGRLTTCEQAEVLYPGSVSLDHLRCVYVQEEAHHDAVKGWLQEFGRDQVNVMISADKFLGCPN